VYYQLIKESNIEATPTDINSNKARLIREITIPAMANPFGFLETPAEERISPRSHSIHTSTGNHPINNAIRERINPATPVPFVWR